jgi:hypothetical protein
MFLSQVSHLRRSPLLIAPQFILLALWRFDLSPKEVSRRRPPTAINNPPIECASTRALRARNKPYTHIEIQSAPTYLLRQHKSWSDTLQPAFMPNILTKQTVIQNSSVRTASFVFAATCLVQAPSRFKHGASMHSTLQNLLAAKLLEGSWFIS